MKVPGHVTRVFVLYLNRCPLLLSLFVSFVLETLNMFAQKTFVTVSSIQGVAAGKPTLQSDIAMKYVHSYPPNPPPPLLYICCFFWMPPKMAPHNASDCSRSLILEQGNEWSFCGWVDKYLKGGCGVLLWSYPELEATCESCDFLGFVIIQMLGTSVASAVLCRADLDRLCQPSPGVPEPL